MNEVWETSDLFRGGFSRAVAAREILEKHPELTAFVPFTFDTADPDQALIQLERLSEAAGVAALRELSETQLRPLITVLSASRAMGNYLVSHPQLIATDLLEQMSAREAMLRAVGADSRALLPVASEDADIDELRRCYYQILIEIAKADLTSADPIEHLQQATEMLTQLADAALEAGLAVARRELDPEAKVNLVILAMGKTGARELNYISDVDVVYLLDDDDSSENVGLATEMVSRLTAVLSAPSSEPPLWQVDAGLRPEGKAGALVRTVSSAIEYYKRWAENWEFQALLKARPAAGNLQVGEKFLGEIETLIWNAAAREGFVTEARKMRIRVEKSVRPEERPRELKLSPGGLRDVEFTAQLLQLVHGRLDPQIRVPNTLKALDALCAHGYIGRPDTARLSKHYRFLRVVEHRAQLQNLRRTHLLPAAETALRALGRSIDPVAYSSSENLLATLDDVRREVRQLHEDVFYRPIVEASATVGGMADPQAAADRLSAIGYRDPQGALKSMEVLTRGTSRTAMIHRNLLPVLLQWLADGADPDLGILSFRKLSEQIGSSHWYLTLLRDSGSAARRLCHVLSNSGWAPDALSANTKAITWLDSDALLEPVEADSLHKEAQALLVRHAEPAEAMRRIQAMVRREATRAGLSDIVEQVKPWRPSLADNCDVAVESALQLALREELETYGQPRAHLCVVGMGSYGARESTYPSDLDMLLIYAPAPGVEAAEATKAATDIGHRFKALLSDCHCETLVFADFDLRPEGRQGALVRTVASYREYYERWASTWEKHALQRSRIICGEAKVCREVQNFLDQWLYQWTPSQSEIKEIRVLKARMENERLPRGVSPQMHLKLGSGGLSDVEWTVQLLQLIHGTKDNGLRGLATIPALGRLKELEMLTDTEADYLQQAWELASRIRAANFLVTGKLQKDKTDILPRTPSQGKPVACLLGLGVEGEGEIHEQWLFAARHARAVMEERFWQ